MSTFPLLISSPDGDLFRGDAEMLILRGTEGDLAVMAGHVPFVTAVVPGNCVVVTAEGERIAGVKRPLKKRLGGAVRIGLAALLSAAVTAVVLLAVVR